MWRLSCRATQALSHGWLRPTSSKWLVGSVHRALSSAAAEAADASPVEVQPDGPVRFSSTIPVPFLMHQAEKLDALKRIVRSYTPKTLTPEVKEDIVNRLRQLFGANEIMAVTLHCCPLFVAFIELAPGIANSCKSGANRLAVVYRSTNDLFFDTSCAKRSNKQPLNYEMEDWLMLQDFGQYGRSLASGIPLYVESAVAPPECVLYRNADLERILDMVPTKCELQTYQFLYKLAGAAVSAFTPDTRYANLSKVADEIDVEPLLLGIWMRHIGERRVDGKQPYTHWPDLLSENRLSKGTVALLKGLTDYRERKKVAEKMYDWHFWFTDRLSPLRFDANFPVAMEECLERMAFSQRASMVTFTDQPVDDESDLALAGNLLKPYQKDMTLMMDELSRRRVAREFKTLKSPFCDVAPKDLVLFSFSGSQLYNLNLPTSDEDIVCVFRWSSPTDLINQLNGSKKDVWELRNIAEQVGDKELAALVGYEVQKFVMLLLNGAIEWAQVLFADSPLYESDHFAKLRDNRHLLLSQSVVSPYVGFIRRNLKSVTETNVFCPPRKALYQVYHKLFQLEELVRGESPTVTMSGENRNFIMQIRTGALEGSTRELKREAEERLSKALQFHDQNMSLLRPTYDRKFVSDWLSELYGLNIQDHAHPSTGPTGQSVFDMLVDGKRLFPDPNDLYNLGPSLFSFYDVPQVSVDDGAVES